MFERRTVLGGLLEPRTTRGAARRLTIGESPGFALLQVCAFTGGSGELEQIVRRLLGANLPQRVGTTGRSSNQCVFKIGPEKFWIVGADDGWCTSLQAAVPGHIGSVVLLSDSRARLFIDGESSRAVLSTAIAIDLHPEAFALDAYALTDLLHTPVLVHRVGQCRYELYVSRSFAAWVWEWLADAALPFGFELAGSASCPSAPS